MPYNCDRCNRFVSDGQDCPSCGPSDDMGRTCMGCGWPIKRRSEVTAAWEDGDNASAYVTCSRCGTDNPF